MSKNKETIRTIVEAVGSDRMQDRLDVSEFSIRAAKRSGSFPASWYRPLMDLCREAGAECPLDAFNWKTPSSDASSSEAS